MTIRVVEPPEPIVTPQEVPGDHSGDDANVMAMIAAATDELDGPAGYLQRALGAQTLELVIKRTSLDGCDLGDFQIPLPPLISVKQIAGIDEEGDETIVDPSDYRVRGIGTDEGRVRLTAGWPDRAEELRIRYRAGYDGDVTGPVPPRAKRAVILAVANLQALGRDNLHLRAEEFQGIGRQEFIVSETAGRVIRQATQSLLAGLRVFR